MAVTDGRSRRDRLPERLCAPRYPFWTLPRRLIDYDAGGGGADEYNQLAVDWLKARLGLCEGC